VRGQLRNLWENPWTLVFPLLAVATLATLFLELRRPRFGRAFVASAAFILDLLATMAAAYFIHAYRLFFRRS
jgi:hypothetical protein